MIKIRESFASYFKSWGIELPDPVPERGNLSQGGWLIRYVVVQDEQGEPSLEFLADHRMTNQRHVHIRSSGDLTSLPALQEGFSYDPDVPGDAEAAEARMKAHNDAVIQDLISKGLF